MAFKATNVLPSIGYDRAKRIAVQLKNLTSTRSSQFSTGANSSQVLALLDNLIALKAQLDEVRTIPGIAAYAQGQEDDPAYDVAQEFTSLLSAVDAVIQEILTTMPSDANGFLLVNQFDVDGNLVPREFTGGQLSGLRAALDLVTSSVT